MEDQKCQNKSINKLLIVSKIFTKCFFNFIRNDDFGPLYVVNFCLKN